MSRDNATYADGSSSLLLVEIDLCDQMTRNQMEIVSLTGNWAVVCSGCTRT
jgi:hypothetical protein